MSTLQVANLHFESTGNNRIQYAGSNVVNIVAGGANVITVNSTSATIAGGVVANGGVGTAGQALLSGGSGANAYWGTLSLSGRLLRAPQILTSGTSYTSPANCTSIYVEAVGGGGGGGGTDGASSIGSQSAGGGGSGAYCAKYFTVTPSTSYSYTIGVGGIGGSGSGGVEGSNGGATTFTVGAVTITANGGIGGGPGQGDTIPGYAGAGGNALNGDLNVNGSPGGAGSSGWSNSTNDLLLSGGHGGSSFFGGGGKGSRSNFSDDTVGTNGGGGGGAASDLSATAYSGSNGGNGLIRLWEFT